MPSRTLGSFLPWMAPAISPQEMQPNWHTGLQVHLESQGLHKKVLQEMAAAFTFTYWPTTM
jgi:hypothetical protein